ncbi:MAG: hypothetical protein U0350_07970 [Caldilineaceae bacterium]
MRPIRRFIGLVLTSALILTNSLMAHAAPQANATAYLPIASKPYPLLNDIVNVIEPAAQGGVFNTPLDATPDPAGTKIYFTAKSAHGAGVFSVPITGGNAVSITVGTPFSVPTGLAMSMNGQMIYVADPSVPMPSTIVASGGNQVKQAVTKGALFRVPATGGTPQVIAGTERTSPRGLEVGQEKGEDMIYFLGNNPSNGEPAVMKIPASGGALTILHQGAPFVNPGGVSLNRANAVWLVTDDAASGNGLGSIFRLDANGQITTLADHVLMGKPAGVALTFDESAALVSTLDPNTGTSQVLVINMTTGEQGIMNKVINVNHASGGLHRARNSTVMAWCGVTAGSGGQGIVFRVEFK